MVWEKRPGENPFEDHHKTYRKAKELVSGMSEADLDTDWIQNKRSNGGSRSPRKPATFVSPGSGNLFRI